MLIPWAIRVLLPLILASVATCTPVRHSQSLQNRQSRSVVSGVHTRDENGHLFVRREVRDLKKNHPDQWNLYLLVLDSLHWTEQSDPLSYYSLAGIHGRPYKTWEDAPGLSHKIGTSGYCPHSNEMFLGWHRPYLVLFEQVLNARMQGLASNAPPERIERYQAAANAFRIPYWDWAQGENTGPVPEFFTTETITVILLDGTERVIHNPLYSYRFRNLNPEDFDEKWRYINETVRWPTSDEPWAQSQQEKFIGSFSGQSSNIINEMGMVFRASNFSRFATRVEQPHGWIHGVVGGGWDSEDSASKGHFWPLEYSAFEPLFMLHHANVDRLFALYQAVHPDRWMGSSNIGAHGNVFLEDFQIVDADTPLLPFRKESGSFLTTNDCRDTTDFGYVYPETQRWYYTTDEEYQANVSSVISKLYGGSARAQLRAEDATARGHTLLAQDGMFTDWMIETQAFASGLPPTFVVRFSFVSYWSSEPSIDVGTWMILMPSEQNNKARTMRAETTSRRDPTLEPTLKGTTSLTAHLIDQISAGKLQSLSPKDVVPYLKDLLTWKVYSGDGTPVPRSDLDALTIQVVSTSAQIPKDPDAPVEYSEDVTLHPEVTMGKSGGVVV